MKVLSRLLSRLLFRLLFLIPVLSCCSIKESRDNCPCYVTLDLADFAAISACEEGRISILNGSSLYQYDILSSDYAGKSYDCRVMRTSSVFTAVVGCEGALFSGDSLVSAPGKQWPALMADIVSAGCQGDREILKMSPEKEYCTAYMTVSGLADEDIGAYGFRVKASCRGICLSDGKCIKAEYSAIASGPSEDSVYSVRMPRQDDYSAILEILVFRDGCEECIAERKLGAMMKEKGYDWNSQSLDDIRLIINLGTATADLLVVPWEDEFFDEQI